MLRRCADKLRIGLPGPSGPDGPRPSPAAHAPIEGAYPGSLPSTTMLVELRIRDYAVVEGVVRATRTFPRGAKVGFEARLEPADGAPSDDLQPAPADVMACRYTWSATSPAANTPGTLVAVASPSMPDLTMM